MKKNAFLSLKLGIIAVLFVSPLGILAAQPVDREELGAGQSTTINFINYEGPYARIETLLQIRGIGADLGSAVLAGAARPGGLNRYFVIHSISGAEEARLDADIFGLGVDVGVDHIRNLRLIIQGYLEEAYRYSAQDAALLAQYVTVYNAVYRGNWDYFTGRYKTAVISNTDRDKAGLSIRFDEWPGRTHIVIPLAYGAAGSLSAVDTSSLTSAEVIDELRKDDDKGLDTRRDMVDLKEREADAASEKAAAERQAIAEQEQRLAQERDKVAQDRQAAQDDAAAGKLTAEEQRRTEEELAAREAELDRQEEELETQREDAAQSEQFAEDKAAEAREERQGIAQDQQSIINQQDGRTPAAQPTAAVAGTGPAGVLGIRLTNVDSPLGRLVQLNAASGAELRTGTMNAVNARSVVNAGGKILAIAGENRGNAAIRLVEINPDTLQTTAQGTDDIHPQSLLWQNGNSLFAITVSGGVPHLARFNMNLVKEVESVITVHAYGTPSFQGDLILIQRENGSAAVLNAANLTERR
ncbi:hypothetical protein AGMMS50267_11840 [Spirochaetia bacterium]|nr:hypothetical protein AGMMS50267_11840 [Spirochaetia bacterium]